MPKGARMSDQVSVRLAVVGGSQFRNEIRVAGQQGAQAMGQISAASRSLGPAVQNAGYQIGDFAVQVAGGSSAVRAFAQQAPQLMGAWGPVGAVIGATVAVVGALAPKLFEGSKSAAEMAKNMTDLTGSMGSVNSAVAAVEAVQRTYNDAISQSGSASSAAAALVIANSAAEFEARKRVLSAEIEIAKFRGADKAAELANLETQFRREGQNAIDSDVAAYGGLRRPGMAQPTGFASRRQMGIPRPSPAFDAFLERNKETPAAIRKIRAEVDLMNMSLEDAEKLMGTTFADIGTKSGSGTKGAKGGGGGGNAATQAAREAQRIFDQTRTSAERYAAAMAELNQLLAQGAIDQDTYNRKAEQLKSEFDSSARFAKGVAMQVKSSLSALFDGIVDGGGKAGDAVENLGKKLASMALQQSAFQLLARLLPNTFGAGGFIPLLANANGNAFSGGRVVPFASGGVVSGPTLFPMSGGAGLMGEAGPEAIMPLTRVGGKLGVRAAGGGGTVVQVINQTGQPVREDRQTGPDGRELVRIVVGEDMARGRFDGPMGRFGSAPAKARRG